MHNISLGIIVLAASALLIGPFVGVAVGFTAALKDVLLVTGVVTILGLSAAGIAQATQKLSAFEQVIRNLHDIK
jgi:hypothetical protein